MKLLALDPSINFVGWCCFNSVKKEETKRWSWGTIRLEGSNYQMRLMMLIQEIEELGLLDCAHLIGEWPTFFAGEKGHIAAHQNYTIDLAGVVAYLAGSMGLDHRHWHLSTATTWKGSVPKTVTQKKFLRIFGKRFIDVSEHAIDATMLMHWWLREYGEATFQREGEVFPESKLLQL